MLKVSNFWIKCKFLKFKHTENLPKKITGRPPERFENEQNFINKVRRLDCVLNCEIFWSLLNFAHFDTHKSNCWTFEGVLKIKKQNLFKAFEKKL